MNVELSELRYFYNVATSRSFAEGARISHVSPPAISKAIKKLEDEVGEQLLERTTRRVTITSHGEIVLAYCRQVLDTLGELESALQDEASELRGELRIGSMEAFTAHALPQAIARLVAAHPRLVPKIYRVGTEQMERLLLEGRLDLGLCLAAEASTRLDSTALATSPSAVVCGRDHPLFGKTEVSADELAECGFVVTQELLEQGRPTAQLPEEFARARIGATVDTLQLAIQLVVDGAYLGCFPEVAMRCQLNHSELSPVSGVGPGPEFEMRALSVGSRASVALLIETLRETVAEALTLDCAVVVR